MNCPKLAALTAAALLFLFTGFCENTSARETDTGENNAHTVISLGKHLVSKGNISSAKEGAISDALENAVEQTILAMLSPQEIASSLPLFSEMLTASPRPHIVTYKVLGEIKKEQQYIVAVESTLDMQALETSFSKYHTREQAGALPRILIFMSEQIPGEILPRYWWGNNPTPFQSLAQQAFAEILTTQEYLPMPLPAKETLHSLAIQFDFIHDADAALRLASQLNADIMVMAKARAEAASNTMGTEQAYKSTIDLEAFQVDTGERITSFTTDAVVKSDFSQTGIQDSLTQSGTLAAETLVARLNNAWSGRRTGPQAIETRIEGDDYLSSFIMLRKILNTMSGIEDIQTRELSSDNAVVDIIYQGNGKKLADALMLKTFESFNLHLADISDTTLTIRFIPKNGETPVETKDIEGAFISE